jgi:hypothetical protein
MPDATPLDLIGRAVRQAGAVDADPLQLHLRRPSTPAGPLAGLDARSLGPLDCRHRRSAGGGGERQRRAGRALSRRRRPDGDGSAVDCAGFAVAAGEEGWSIFYVARNGDGEPELRCKYRGAAQLERGCGGQWRRQLPGPVRPRHRRPARRRRQPLRERRARSMRSTRRPACRAGVQPADALEARGQRAHGPAAARRASHAGRPRRRALRPAVRRDPCRRRAAPSIRARSLREVPLPDGLRRRERGCSSITVALPAGAS